VIANHSYRKLDYRGLFARSWEYLWRSKFIWLYQALTIFASGFSSGMNALYRYGEGVVDNPLYGFLSISLCCLSIPLMLLGLIAHAGVIHSIYMLSLGMKPSLANTWAPIRKNLWRLLGVSILISAFAFLVAAIFLFAIYTFFEIEIATPIQMVWVFFILIWVAVFIASGWWTISYCAVMIEDKNAWEGINHSLDVALNGLNWLEMGLLYLLLYGITQLPGLIAFLGIAALRSRILPDTLHALDYSSYLSITSTTAYRLVIYSAGFVTGYIFVSVLTLAYLDMIRLPEPVDQQVATD
jgi:hypothetical protein